MSDKVVHEFKDNTGFDYQVRRDPDSGEYDLWWRSGSRNSWTEYDDTRTHPDISFEIARLAERVKALEDYHAAASSFIKCMGDEGVLLTSDLERAIQAIKELDK